MSETAYKMVEIKNGHLKSLKKLNLSLDEINKPRQKFPKTYSPNGVIDIYRKKVIMNEKKLLGKKINGAREVRTASHQLELRKQERNSKIPNSSESVW